MNTIGQRLKAARENQGYTLQQLCQLVGIEENHLIAFEGDRCVPPISMIFTLKNALNCSLDWLLSGESKEIEPLESNSIGTSGLLSPEEAQFLSVFRLLDDSDRQCVYELTDLLYKKTQRLRDLSVVADTDLHLHT